MAGIDMLLKAFGINPDEIKQVAANAQILVQGFTDKLNAIEKKQDRILALLTKGEHNGRYGRTSTVVSNGSIGNGEPAEHDG
jgi:hypothetical protein